MTVLKVGFVGIRSDRLQETVALFRDVIGVPVTRQTNDLVGCRLANGTVFELYGPGDEFHAFFTAGSMFVAPTAPCRREFLDASVSRADAAAVRVIASGSQHRTIRAMSHRMACSLSAATPSNSAT